MPRGRPRKQPTLPPDLNGLGPFVQRGAEEEVLEARLRQQAREQAIEALVPGTLTRVGKRLASLKMRAAWAKRKQSAPS